MCDYRDQNAKKNMKVQIWSLSSETSNIEFQSSKLQILSFEVSFWIAKNFIFEVIKCLLEFEVIECLLEFEVIECLLEMLLVINFDPPLHLLNHESLIAYNFLKYTADLNVQILMYTSFSTC